MDFSTSTLFLFMAVLLMILIIFGVISKTKKGPDASYKSRQFILTKNEIAFYNSLLPIAQTKNLTVFVKVRLADIIEPEGQKNRQANFNRIKSKHVDFALCDKQLRYTMIIELDDASHQRQERKNRDSFVDSALSSAGIPILHTLSSTDLPQKIDKLITPKQPQHKKVRM